MIAIDAYGVILDRESSAEISRYAEMLRHVGIIITLDEKAQGLTDVAISIDSQKLKKVVIRNENGRPQKKINVSDEEMLSGSIEDLVKATGLSERTIYRRKEKLMQSDI